MSLTPGGLAEPWDWVWGLAVRPRYHRQLSPQAGLQLGGLPQMQGTQHNPVSWSPDWWGLLEAKSFPYFCLLSAFVSWRGHGEERAKMTMRIQPRPPPGPALQFRKFLVLPGFAVP